MESRNLCLCEKDTRKISVCDQILSMKPDSFRVDMEPFSHTHLTNKDLTFNSRYNLQRILSRKGSQFGEEKMSNPSDDNERDVISSPKEKSTAATTMVAEPQTHHQITIITGTTNTIGTPTKNMLAGKRSSSFKQTTSFINPRRIMLLFATLSSMGTILLIYFTLCIARHKGDDN